ncbi:MAG: hypothetical protein GY874_05280 [Desulfobacteraceae bacterium]|nr:hypothetical protein [Desulfobacteraceae bacterium]
MYPVSTIDEFSVNESQETPIFSYQSRNTQPQYILEHTEHDLNSFKEYATRYNVDGLCASLCFKMINESANGLKTTLFTDAQLNDIAKKQKKYSDKVKELGTQRYDIDNFAKDDYSLNLTSVALPERGNRWSGCCEHSLFHNLGAKLEQLEEGSYYLTILSPTKGIGHGIAIFKTPNGISYYNQDQGLTQETEAANIESWLQSFTDNAQIDMDGGLTGAGYNTWELFKTEDNGCCVIL